MTGLALGRTGSTRRRASWSIADQGLSSLTNFALTIIVARSASVGEFGAFELTLSIYLFALGASRAISSEPLMVRHSDDSGPGVAQAAAQATGVAVVVAVVAAPVCVGVGTLLEEPSGHAVRALALCLPGLLLQDAWRFAFFAAGHPAKAAANDALWGISQLVIVGWLVQRQGSTIADFVLAWGASATLAAAVGAVQAGVVPRPLDMAHWLRRHRDLGPRFLGEFAVGLGSFQLSLWLIGFIGGLAVLGAIRAASVVLGPLRILLIAAPGAAIPELVRLRTGSVQRVTRTVTTISLALGLLIGAWGVGAWLLPASIGELVVGDSWEPARRVLLLITLSWSGLGLATGPMIGLRALAAARRSFRTRLLVAPALLFLPVIGVALGGLTGAGAGMAAVTCGSAVLWATQFRAELRHGVRPDAPAASDPQLAQPPAAPT
jgi:O-antigen/teichoic acid export membrane protein